MFNEADLNINKKNVLKSISKWINLDITIGIFVHPTQIIGIFWCGKGEERILVLEYVGLDVSKRPVLRIRIRIRRIRMFFGLLDPDPSITKRK